METNTSQIILLVEDNPVDAKLASRALKHGHIANPIVHLNDGDEAFNYIFAIEAFANRNIKDLPALILLDIMMPKMNGIELLQMLKADKRTKDIPVVVFVFSPADPDVEVCRGLGVNNFLVKPLEFDALSKVLKDMQLSLMITDNSGNRA